MWVYMTTLYKQVNYIRKSREKFESRNRNIFTCLHGYLKVFPEVLANGSDTTTKTDSKCYKFCFKNLVLAGGGATVVAYCGVARALEEHGILKDIRRFAGSDGGAIVAALLSFGFNSYDVEKIMSGVTWDGMIKDTSYEMLGSIGSRPVEKFRKMMGDVFAIKTEKNNPDITFQEAYEEFGKELCIIVTNLNTMSEEYCHVRTTPHMPIREALCMSISLPVRNQTVPYKMFGETSKYIDGALFCKYPIHCFDGWYLSMKRNMPLEMYTRPFKSMKTNLETLGCLVYSANQYQIFRGLMERKCKAPQEKFPNTKLSREWKDMTENQQIDTFTELLQEVENKFLDIFKAHDPGSLGKKEFSYEEFNYRLTKAWVDEAGTENSAYREARTYAEMIYGPNVNARMIFEEIQKTDNDKVTLTAIENFVIETSKSLMLKYRDVVIKRNAFDGKTNSLVATLINCFKRAAMKNNFREDDVARTVGINTGYIESTDYAMETEDITFLINRGKVSTEEFLKHFGYDHYLQFDKKPKEFPKNISLTEQDLAKLKPRYYDNKDVLSFFVRTILLLFARFSILVVLDFNKI